MRKIVVAICFIFLCGEGVIQPLNADAGFSETFLGSGTDGDFFDVWEGWSARFAFDMTASGDTATLYNAAGSQVGSARPPTLDETGFIPGSNRIDAAHLAFTISSGDLARDTVRIHSGFYDGNECLLEDTYILGNWVTALNGERKYADLTMDLLALGLGQYLEDGRSSHLS